jgi:hypothetical protein
MATLLNPSNPSNDLVSFSSMMICHNRHFHTSIWSRVFLMLLLPLHLTFFSHVVNNATKFLKEINKAPLHSVETDSLIFGWNTTPNYLLGSYASNE